MLWEVEIAGKLHDPERARVAAEFALLTHGDHGELLARTTRGYLLEGDIEEATAQRLVDELLVDPVVETFRLSAVTHASRDRQGRESARSPHDRG